MRDVTDAGPPTLSLIVAMDRNGLIGRGADLPWRLPADLAHFKRMTLGKTVLMGRRTWDSIGRPLPGRDNWVLSRDPGFAPAGARTFDSLEAALAAHGQGELMVMGGADLYRQALPLARRLYLTEVLATLEPAPSGDVHFPPFDRTRFRQIGSEAHEADERHPHAFRFLTLERD